MAAIQRQLLLGKALNYQEWKVTVISPRSIHSCNSEIKRIGKLSQLLYIYLYHPIRKTNFFTRNFQKLFEPFVEFALLLKLKNKHGIDIAIISHPNSFLQSIKYRSFSSLIGFKIFYNLVENYYGRNNTPLFRKTNNLLFNKFGVNFYDAILPISSNLNKDLVKSVESLIVPIIVDFDKIDAIESKEKLTTRYFAYCGSAGYYEAINFLIRSFIPIKKYNFKLVMVINGSHDELKRINNDITKYSLTESIELKMNLSNEQLYSIYKNSSGLLLPLFNTIQDNNRFPHKLAEYLASGVVVITHAVGDVANYLKDKENVLFAEIGSVESFSRKIEWVISNKEEAMKIGSAGKKVCKKYFDYKMISTSLSSFLRKYIEEF